MNYFKRSGVSTARKSEPLSFMSFLLSKIMSESKTQISCYTTHLNSTQHFKTHFIVFEINALGTL